MKSLYFEFDMVKRDADGEVVVRDRDTVKLRLRDKAAQAALGGSYDLGLSLALQHIAELQGMSYAGIHAVSEY